MKRFIKFIFTTVIVFILGTNAAFAYPDVDDSHKYFDSIEFITFRNITGGYPDGTFQPDRVLNRAELLKIVIEAEYSDEFEAFSDQSCFTDTIDGEWYNKYVCFAKDEGIISGYDDGTFRPSDPINLVEALKIVMETFGFAYPGGEPWFKGLVEEASDRDFIPTDFYDFDQEVNRGQMAEVITRVIKYNVGSLDQFLGDKKEMVVTYESLKAGVYVEDWIIHRDEVQGYSIMYPENFRKIDFTGSGIGVGPEDVAEDILWSVQVFETTEKTKDQAIEEIGEQFGDERSIMREDITLLDGISAEKVVVTTSELPDWYSETIFIEDQSDLYMISNGAVQDEKFSVFYKSFRFFTPTVDAPPSEESFVPSTEDNPLLPEIENIVFSFFESPSYFFRLMYPNQWYYTGEAPTEEGVQRHYYFSAENPFPEESPDGVEVPQLVMLDVIDQSLMVDDNTAEFIDLGEIFVYKTTADQIVSIYRTVGPRSYRLSGSTEYEDIMVHMAASIEEIPSE